MSRIDNIYVERNGVYNHWGLWVDPNIPITGVISNNSIVQFISDEMYNGIELDWDEFMNSDEFDPDEDYNYFENTTWLIGDWIKDPDDGLWDYDPDGEYAAIVNESTTQVVYSKYTRKCLLCSPCYPGQADLDNPGEFLAYDIPPDGYIEY